MNPQRKIALLSFGISSVLTLVKFGAYFITDSNAVLTDALESVINVLAGGFAFFSVSVSAQPKDQDHPYGHGKVEFFSQGVEGVLICVASFYVIIDSVRNLFEAPTVRSLDVGLYVIVGGMIVNFILGKYLQIQGKNLNSPTLRADGKHLVLDAQSAVILIVALGLMYKFGWTWLDSVAAIGFGLWMGWEGYKMAREAVWNLMDKTDTHLLEKVTTILQTNRKDFWIDVHNLRVQKYGSDLHIDCHVTLPRFWNLEQVHDAVQDVEQTFKNNLQGEVEIFIHTDPCLPECCHYCALKDCTVRGQAFNKNITWTQKNLTTNRKHFA
jgi:cation diffusion facilitator family transporter